MLLVGLILCRFVARCYQRVLLVAREVPEDVTSGDAASDRLLAAAACLQSLR